MTTGQTSGRLTTRDLTVDDIDAAFDIRTRSFGRLSPSLRDWWDTVQKESINEHRTIGAFDGERLLAHARVRSYQQFWGGRPMPMGGVAGVVVAPDARGRGVGSRLMTAIARRSLELGDLVSALYPATIPMYRALGWEVAGAQYRINLPPEALRTLGGKDIQLRRATESDVEPFLTRLHDRYVVERANGPKLPTRSEAREQLIDEGMMSYVGDGGHVVYEWAKEDLVVSYLSADTPEIARTLWSVVGSGSSIVRSVVAYVAPDDPIQLLLPEEIAHEMYLKRWMLRLLDVQKAVAARGFSPAVAGSARYKNDLDILYPSPDATADVVVAPIRGSAHGGRVTQLLQDSPARAIFARQGWRVEGQPLAPAIREVPLGPSNGLPDAGVFVALSEVWSEVHR